MPLTLAKIGEENTIKRIGGRPDTKQFLKNLGFVPGAFITIVNEINGNVIVCIKESRVAISREMAVKIMV
ncbi:MAG: ferrous iron transport protein A [Clostridiales Family XIII bacterium]|jgi:ferrous iron transport protein A|nr:ferrous iron transport protein A [Clostridiales Family XIII bacterium]